jgi:hypothetical protein
MLRECVQIDTHMDLGICLSQYVLVSPSALSLSHLLPTMCVSLSLSLYVLRRKHYKHLSHLPLYPVADIKESLKSACILCVRCSELVIMRAGRRGREGAWERS